MSITPSREGDAVSTRALLVDPSTRAVLWASDPATLARLESGERFGASDALQLPATVGLEEAVAGVADTGRPRHVSASLVATSRATVTLVVSVYALPDGALLVLADTSWHVRRGSQEGGDEEPRRRRGR